MTTQKLSSVFSALILSRDRENVQWIHMLRYGLQGLSLEVLSTS